MSSNKYRARLLAGASVAVIAVTLGMGTSEALAQSTTVNDYYIPDANAIVGTASADISASIEQRENHHISAFDAFDGAGINVSLLTNGTVAAVDNAVEAIAEGNSHAITGSIGGVVSLDDGYAAILTQIVSPHHHSDARVTSNLYGNYVDYSVTGSFTSGTVDVSANTISAQTTLNSGTNTADVTATTNFSTTVPGSVALNFPSAVYPTILTTGGNVDVTTGQFDTSAQQGAGSKAIVYDNNIYTALDTADSGADTIMSTIAVDGNTVSATYQGNSVNAGITLDTTSLTNYTGSLTLATVQVNAFDATDDRHAAANAAFNGDSSVYASLAGAYTNTLTGSVSVSGNTISSSATGNLAYAPGDAPTGNIITIMPGASIDSALTPVTDTVTYPGGGSLISSVGADIVVANVQANLSSSLSGETSGANIYAIIPQITTGSVSIGSNSITSTVAGSQSLNEIVGGSALTTSITATMAVQNVQTNDGSSFSATVGGVASSIYADVGTDGGSVTNATVEIGGSVTVGSTTTSLGNLIGAVALGNETANIVDLTGATLDDNASTVNTAGGGLYFKGDRSFDTIADLGINIANVPGLVVLNVQSNLDGSPVTATTTAPSISLTVGDKLSTVTNSTFGVDNNTLQAIATGNIATGNSPGYGTGAEGIFLATPSTFVGNAGVASIQTQTGAVNSILTDGVVLLSIVPSVGGVTASVTGNTLASIAQANYADNAITVTTSGYSNSNGGDTYLQYIVGVPAPFDYNPGPGPANSLGPQPNGALVMLNDQYVSTNVVATNTYNLSGSLTGNPISIAFGGDFAGTTANNNSNVISSLAEGNVAISSVSLNASGGVVSGGNNGPGVGTVIGVAENVQTDGAPLISATTASYLVADSLGTGIVTGVAGSTSGTVNLMNNTYSAGAIGNTASTSVDASAADEFVWNTDNNHQSSEVNFQGVQSFEMFDVANGQATTAGTVMTASISAGNVLAQLGTNNSTTSSVGATVMLTGNGFQAQAMADQATNTLSVGATAVLQATGGLINDQRSLSDVSASIGVGGDTPSTPSVAIQIGQGAVSGATLTVGSNTFGTISYSNQAMNVVNATSGGTATTQSTGLTTPYQGISSSVLSYNGSLNGSSHTGMAANIGGDYTLGNLQQFGGDNSATTFASAYIEFGAGFGGTLGGGLGAVSNTTASVTGNSITADAQGNVGGNLLAISTSTSGAAGTPTGAIGSWQIAGFSNTAQTIRAESFGRFGISTTDGNTGTILSSTFSVTGGTVAANAGANDVSNTLSVTSHDSLVTAYDVAATASSSYRNTSFAVPPGPFTYIHLPTVTGTVDADDVIYNLQDNLGAAVSAGTSAIGGITFDANPISNSMLTVSNNNVTATAYSNSAMNSLTLTAGTTVSATGAILNAQFDTGTVQAGADGLLAITVGSTVATSTLTVGTNSILASAAGNSASNVLTATAPDGFAAPAALAPISYSVSGPDTHHHTTDSISAGYVILSEQLNTSGIGATAAGTIGVTTTDSIANTPIAVNANTITASAGGNSVVDTMGLTGDLASGAIGNGQINSGAILATVDAPVTGIGITLGTGGVSGGTLNVMSNLVQASATGDGATNDLTLSVLTQGIGAVVSTQTNSGAVAASVGSESPIGIGIGGGTGAISVGAANVTGNDVSTTAMANDVTNSLTVTSGTNLASTVLDEASASAELRIFPHGTGLTSSGVTADELIDNTQNNDGGAVSASTTVLGGIFLVSNSVSGGALTVSDNVASAQAWSNYAVNALVVSAGTSIGATGAILNVQYDPGSVTSFATGTWGIATGGTVTSSTLSVGENYILATAAGNYAMNSVTATAPDGFVYPANGVVDPVSVNFDDRVTGSVSAGYVILNEQLNTSAVTSTASGSIGVVTGGAVTDTPIAVTFNAIWSSAAGSGADNSLVLNGDNASGAIGNGQLNTGPIIAKVDFSTVGLTIGTGGVSGGALGVSDNVVEATATGNGANNSVVLNAVDAGAEGTIASAQTNSGVVVARVGSNRGSTLTIGITTSGGVTGGVLNVTDNSVDAIATGNGVANSLVLNSNAVGLNGTIQSTQNNTGPVVAQVENLAIGINAGMATISGGVLNVTGNAVVAQATGNSSDSTLVLNGPSATGSVDTSQTNSGSVRATITDVTIGTTSSAPGSITASNSIVAGNQIVAMAVGNSGSTTIIKH